MLSDALATSTAATTTPTSNPHALESAQQDDEVFEVMVAPPTGFDIYKDKPCSTGKLKTRKVVHDNQDWHCSVHVWLVDETSGEILLQQRSPKKDTFPGRWDISAAGHIAANDKSARDTAVSEVAEELGLVISPTQLEYAFVCPAEQAPWGGCNAYEHVFFLRCNKDDCKFAIGQAEVTALKWIALNDLKMAWEASDEAYVPRVELYKEAFFRHLRE